MRPTIITRLQRFLLLFTLVATCSTFHAVKAAHGPGWSWWAWAVLFVGLVLIETILRTRTETTTEAHARRTEARRLRWHRNEARRRDAERRAWLREQ
jgi:small-conductance mechanosensitive channel